MAADDAAVLADLDLAPNEASGLVRVRDADLVDRLGWDLALWTVLDEVDAEDAVALLGHERGADLGEGWHARRVSLERTGDQGDADDAEAVAHWEGWVYVLGSHHGGKEGPIRRREQWIARFREDAVDLNGDRPAELQLVNTGFRWHRLLNDALAEGGLELLPMGDAARRAFIDDTREEEADVAQEGLVREGDWTVNIEGAEVTAEGVLLLGLRYPVTADGRPLIVGVEGWTGVFDGEDRAEVVGVWPVDAIGREGSLAGVRDLCLDGDELHVVTGNLDSTGKGSVILDDHPEGETTVNTHFVLPLEAMRAGDGRCEVVREFPDLPRVEGIATDGAGGFFYVSDEDERVHLRGRTPLVGGGR